MTHRQKPYADPVGRFARVLERHEAQIARHTAIQSTIAGWQLFVGTVTTIALIYIAYQQFNAAERQVALEYAKVAPRFSVSTTVFQTKKSLSVRNSFPKSISLAVSTGNTKIENLETFQDFRVSVALSADKSEREIHTCIVRSKSYFANNSTNTGGVADDRFAQFAAGPVFGYPDAKTFFVISPVRTWVKITYVDVFGENASALFAGENGLFRQIPGSEPSEDQTYDTVSAELSSSRSLFPAVWNSNNFAEDGCNQITKSALFVQ